MCVCEANGDTSMWWPCMLTSFDINTSTAGTHTSDQPGDPHLAVVVFKTVGKVVIHSYTISNIFIYRVLEGPVTCNHTESC